MISSIKTRRPFHIGSQPTWKGLFTAFLLFVVEMGQSWVLICIIVHSPREVIHMKTILVPVDGSTFSTSAVQEAKKIAEAFGSKIILLSVARYESYLSVNPVGIQIDKQDLIEQEKETAERNLARAKGILGSLADNCETVLTYGDAATQILNYLDDHKVDLVIMGSQGMGASGLRRLFIGSVTYKVLHNALQPVLVVKQ